MTSAPLKAVVAVPALAFLPHKLVKGKSPAMGQTQEGAEVPVSTVFSQVNTPETGKSLAKEANANQVARLSRQQLAPLLGMTVPGALGLDYLYNRHVKYKDHPQPEAERGLAGHLLYRGGKAVAAHPFTALGAGAVAGGTGKAIVRGHLAKQLRLARQDKQGKGLHQGLEERIAKAEEALGRAKK